MLRSLWTSASGMIAQQTHLDVVTHNLANVNTTGYKKRRADFEDLMYQIGREPGSPIEPDSPGRTWNASNSNAEFYGAGKFPDH